MRIPVDPSIGLTDFNARRLAFGIGIDRSLVRDFVAVAKALYNVASTDDATLADREAPTIALTALGRALGANIFRVHNVKANAQALRMAEAVLQTMKSK